MMSQEIMKGTVFSALLTYSLNIFNLLLIKALFIFR